MGVGAIVGGALGVGSALIGRNTAKDQARAINKSGERSAELAAQARRDALSLFSPAFSRIFDATQTAREEILGGRTRTFDILQQATGNASDLLRQGNTAAQAAILGQPVPRLDQRLADQLVGGGPQFTRPSPTQQDNQFGIPGRPQPGGITTGIRPQPGTRPTLEQTLGGFNPDPRLRTGIASGRQGGTPLPPNVLRPDININPGLDGAGGIRGRGGILPPGADQVGPTQQGGFQPSDLLSNLQDPLAPADVDPFSIGQTPGISSPVTATGQVGLSGQEAALSGALSGAEQALLESAAGQQLALEQGAGAGIGTLSGSGQQALDLLGQNVGSVGNILGGAEGRIGDIFSGAEGRVGDIFSGAEGRIGQSFQRGEDALLSGQQAALGEISGGVNRATRRLNPFANTGISALQREAALSGALGPEAEAAAQAAFTESPGQKFLRERQEQALLRTAGARGGLRGGNVATALQEQAAGIAAQQQQQRLENLRSLAGRGQQAAGQQAGFEQQGGLAKANVFTGTAAQRAGLMGQQAGQIGQLAGQRAGLTGQLAGQRAGLTGQLAGQFAGLANQSGLAGANIAQQTGRDISGIQTALGQQLGNVFGQTGQQLAGARLGIGGQVAGARQLAGQQLAQQANQLASGLSQQQLGLGQQLAGVEQQTAANLSNLARQLGVDETQLLTGLASLLGNISSGQANQQLQLGQLQAQAAGGQGAANQALLGQLGQFAGLLGG